MYYWQLMGGGQGAVKAPTMHRQPLQQRILQLEPPVPRLRKPSRDGVPHRLSQEGRDYGDLAQRPSGGLGRWQTLSIC